MKVAKGLPKNALLEAKFIEYRIVSTKILGRDLVRTVVVAVLRRRVVFGEDTQMSHLFHLKGLFKFDIGELQRDSQDAVSGTCSAGAPI